MKAVLISIQPKWCELIANGKKTIEVRKTKPKLETPFKVYIYCTKDKNFTFCTDNGEQYTHIGNGKVIGEFVCDMIYELHEWHLDPRGVYQEVEEENLRKLLKMTQLTYDELCLYRNGMPYYKPLYAWHISNLIIYDNPRELSEFKKHNRTCYYEHLGFATPKCKECKDCQITRPPQSWCYVESEGGSNETR